MEEVNLPRGFRRRHKILALVISIGIALIYLSASKQGIAQLSVRLAPGSALVTKAVDGDTLDIKIDGKSDIVRLIGVDTPETHDPRKPVQCFGQTAAAYTKQVAEGKVVRLEADPQDSNRDKYNRLLRYVYLPDNTLLNAKLIQDGYGFAYVVFPFSKLDEFRSYEQTARTENKGLWNGCNVDSSQAIKQTTSNK